MTTEGQRLADEQMRVEIGKMLTETYRLGAEMAKIKEENRRQLLVVGPGATLAIVAIARLFL